VAEKYSPVEHKSVAEAQQSSVAEQPVQQQSVAEAQ
jgi:hypothetical protein